MTTMKDMEARKAEQRAEADAIKQAQDDQLRAAGIDPRAQDELEETGAADDPNPQAQDAQDDAAKPAPKSQEETAEPVRTTPSANKRAAIAGRFKVHRGDPQAQVTDEADVRSQGTVYGAHTVKQEQPPEPEPDQSADQQQEQPPQERKIVLKVRGQERELPEAEVLALAQKAAAADDYLGEARQKLDQAEQILLRAKAPRGAEARQHPDENDPAASIAPEDGSEAPSQHPETELEGLINEIRYGNDDKEAAQKLARYLHGAVQQGTAQEDLRRTMQNDATRARQQIERFFAEDANADLRDPIAQAAMRDLANREMVEDLRNAGIDDSRMPKDPLEVRNWHRYLRVTGHNVRSVEAITTKVATDVRAWRGVPKSPDPQPAPKPGNQPRVVVDRQERRLSIPQQPSRATALPALPKAAPDRTARASAVVQQMRRNRGQIVTT